jgi:NAD(P)-dependent dehydrogenase (short-subunit alcohol dehydrogenase family)
MTENGIGALTEEQVLNALRGVSEPATGRGLVDLRLIPGVQIHGRDVQLTIELLSPIRTTREKIERDVRAALGTIGGLVHGAGITGPGGIDELDEAVWDATLAIHLKAGALLIRDLVPDLAANPGSAVVVISSIEGIIAHPAIVSYCAAKAGLLGLMRSTAARLGPRGIRANAICPGFIETPMFLPALDHDPAARPAYEQRIPLRRLGRPEDIGRVARFLLSDDAAYVTGHEMVVDGGVIKTTF